MLQDSLPENPAVLFVCSSPDAHEKNCRYAFDIVSALGQTGVFCRSFSVLDRSSAWDAADLVAQSDLVYLAGGHVPTQNAFFQEIGLPAILRDYPGTIMGVSAGSMNLADTVYAQPENDGEAIDPEYERFLPGLALTDIRILPHYQKVRNDILDGMRLFEDITYHDSFGNDFFVLPDGSYFYQSEDELLLFGEAYLIRDGQISFLNSSGNCLNMDDFS